MSYFKQSAVLGILLDRLVNTVAESIDVHRCELPQKHSAGIRRLRRAWLVGAAVANGLRVSSTFMTLVRSSASGIQSDNDGESELSWRHPLTGLALVVLLVLASKGLSQLSSLQQATAILILATSVLIAVTDFERRRIPLSLIKLLAGLALAFALFAPQPSPSLLSAMAGGVASGTVFCAVYHGGKLYRRIVEGTLNAPMAADAVGLGDVYLMAIGGVIVGFPLALALVLLAVFLGGIGALAWLLWTLLRKRRIERFTFLPYGPNILAATALVLYFREDLTHWILAILG